MFSVALPVILKLEGGYANHPKDPGGATNYGITHRVYNSYRASKKLPIRPVRDIEKHEVYDIYERWYWDACQANLFDDTHPSTALVHFDCAVNCGTSTAIRLLQDVLGVTVDGMFGKVTLAAIKKMDDVALAKALLTRRFIFYNRLVAKKPNLSVFRKSWLHRLNYISKKQNLNWSSTNVG